MNIRERQLAKVAGNIVTIFLVMIGTVPGKENIVCASDASSNEQEFPNRDVVLCISSDDSYILPFKYPRPKIWAEVTNQGDSSVKLARPGDGSWRNGRTPKLKWVVRPTEDPQWAVSQHRIGCGNMNRIERRCTFVLKPGESKQLSRWVQQPRFPGPGTYFVHLEYVNDPEYSHSATRYAPGAKKRLESSDKVKLVSNIISITVME